MNICNRRYIFYSVHFYKKTALFIIQHWKKNCFSLCFFYGENVFLRYLRVRCFFVQTAIRVHTTTFIIIL